MNPESNVAAVILAAGRSSRMPGGDKLMLSIAGKTLLRHAVDNARGSDLREIIVVAGDNLDRVQSELRDLDIKVLHNERCQYGMSTSLTLGIEAVDRQCQGALVLLADQPNLSTKTIDRFVHALRQTKKRIIAGRNADFIGNPALFHRSLFPELRELTGDTGAREILQRHPQEVVAIDIPRDEVIDVDTPKDLRRISALFEAPGAPEK